MNAGWVFMDLPAYAELFLALEEEWDLVLESLTQGEPSDIT